MQNRFNAAVFFLIPLMVLNTLVMPSVQAADSVEANALIQILPTVPADVAQPTEASDIEGLSLLPDGPLSISDVTEETSPRAAKLSGPLANLLDSIDLTRNSSGIYEISVDAVMRSEMRKLFPAAITSKYEAGDLTAIELKAIELYVQEQLANQYDFLVMLPSNGFIDNSLYYGNVQNQYDGLWGLTIPDKFDVSGVGLEEAEKQYHEVLAEFLPLMDPNYSDYMTLLNKVGERQVSSWVDMREIFSTAGVDTASLMPFVAIHELAHRWLLKFGSTAAVSDQLNILSADADHWSVFFDANNGMMNNFDWEDLGGGRFKLKGFQGASTDEYWDAAHGFGNVNYTSAFNDFELYGMGLLPANQVRSSYVIENPRYLGTPLTEENFVDELGVTGLTLGATIDGTKRTVTVDDLIRVNGVRNPASSVSDKNFSVGFVIVKDSSESSLSLQTIRTRASMLRDSIVAKWSEATRGLSTLSLTAATGVFNAFQKRALDIFDGLVNFIKKGIDALKPGQSGPARETDLSSRTIAAQANMAVVSGWDSSIQQMQDLISQLDGKIQDPNLRAQFNILNTQFNEKKRDINAQRTSLDAAIQAGAFMNTWINVERIDTDSLLSESAVTGVLPAGFGKTMDDKISRIDAEYVRRIDGLGTANQSFTNVKDALKASLDSIMQELQSFETQVLGDQRKAERLAQIETEITRAGRQLTDARARAELENRELAELAAKIGAELPVKKSELETLMNNLKTLTPSAALKPQVDAFISEIEALLAGASASPLTQMIQNQLELIEQKKQEWNWKFAALENYVTVVQNYRSFIQGTSLSDLSAALRDEVQLSGGMSVRWAGGRIQEVKDAQGNVTRYQDGKIVSITTAKGLYEINESAAGDLTIHPSFLPAAGDYALIPYLYHLSAAQEFESSGHAFSLSGNVALDTANAKTGTASAMFGGANDYLTVNDSTDWDFGTGDFSVDFWVNFDEVGASKALVSIGDGWGGAGLYARWTGNFVIYTGGGVAFVNPWDPAARTWYHVAITRSGTELRVFINGTQLGSTAANTANIQGETSGVLLGRQPDGGLAFKGWFDQFRVSKGTARWTSDFTPPVTVERDEHTSLVLDFTNGEFSTHQESVPAAVKTELPGGIAFPADSHLKTVLVPAAIQTGWPVLDPLKTSYFTANLGNPLTLIDTKLAQGKALYQSASDPRAEVLPDGKIRYHVLAGEPIQPVIDHASPGDVVYLEAGVYHEHLVLKSGVNLEGAGYKSVTLHGDYETKTHTIRALGGNKISGLTITGGGEYSGYPSSAVRIEGSGVTVTMNWFEDNRDYAVFVWSGADAVIEQNVFLNNHLGVQLPKDTTVIRNNTFVKNGIAINTLGGAKPLIENNIITESTFQAIYEYAWGQSPNEGYAIVQNNTLYNNQSKGGYYTPAAPPAISTQTQGNRIENPGFSDPKGGNFALMPTSPSLGRGANLLQPSLQAALNAAFLRRVGGLTAKQRFAFRELKSTAAEEEK